MVPVRVDEEMPVFAVAQRAMEVIEEELIHPSLGHIHRRRAAMAGTAMEAAVHIHRHRHVHRHLHRLRVLRQVVVDRPGRVAGPGVGGVGSSQKFVIAHWRV